jgi:hypothetical protein
MVSHSSGGSAPPLASRLEFRRISAVLDTAEEGLYNAPRFAPALLRRAGAQVAQLVEHVTENHGVGGSIPPLGTTSPFTPVRRRSLTVK